MRDHDLLDRLADDLGQLRTLAADLPRVRADFWTWAEDGYPTTSGGPGGRGGHSDPVGARADSERGFTDPIADAMRKEYTGIEDDLAIIHLAVKRLERRRQLATTRRATVPSAPGCASCARVRIVDIDGNQVPLWSKVHNAHEQLCRWCTDFAKKWKARPAPALVELHYVQKVGNIRDETVVEHMPGLEDRARELRRGHRRRERAS